jgi:tetratricopeptide (TPR) repeat protein
MRRLIAVSLATTLLGGCSRENKPPQPSATADAGLAQRTPEQPSKLTQPLPPPPPHEPTAMDKAIQVHREGRLTGESGNLQEALKLFQQARELAPEWPLPVYDTALTYLLMGDNAKALEVYEQVDKLAPEGFSDTKRVIECLRREKSGQIPKGTFRKFIDAMRSRTPEELQKKLQELTRTAPKFYPAWRELVPYGKDPAEQLRMLEKTLTLKPDLESKGELLIYKSTLLRRAGKDEEARKLLQSIVDDPQWLPSTVSQAREMLNLKLTP